MSEALSGEVGAVVRHERLAFPSYPYEWPAEMLHASGLLTLDLALAAFDEGLGLKDATPWNVLFRGPTPVFVDWLSVERRDAARPDVAALRAVRAHVPAAAGRPPRVPHAARSDLPVAARRARARRRLSRVRPVVAASSRRCWRTRRCRRGWRAAARPATRRRGRPNASRTPNGRATSCDRCSRGSGARWCA